MTKRLSPEEEELRRPLPVLVLLTSSWEPVKVKRGPIRTVKARRVKK